MWFIEPVADDEAKGLLRELYDQDVNDNGYVRNVTRSWSNRPELLPLWQQLFKGIRSNLRLRAFELVTLAAARAIGCRYCMLAHGAVLRKNGFTAQQLIAVLEDYHNAGLSPVEVHMMDYATKISTDVSKIEKADIEQLRQDGLSDQQITDVALAATARNFLSRFFHAMGAESDEELANSEPELWAYLKDKGHDFWGSV